MEFYDFPTPRTANQCRDKSISSQIQFFPNGESIEAMLQSTAEYLKLLTKSDGFIIYQYDDLLKELYLCPAKTDQEHCFPHRYKWQIDSGNTIATTVFKRLCPLLVDCYSTADLNYPYMQDIAALSPRYIMSLPLMTFGRRCFGVVEYYRQDGVQYKSIELRLCQFMLNNCAEALKQNENAVLYSNYNEIQDNLQALMEAHAFSGSPNGSYYFLHKVVLMTREITRSTISSMFFEKQGKFMKIVNTSEGYGAKQDSKNVYTIGPMSKSRMLSHFRANILNHRIHGMLRACDKIGHTDFSPLDKHAMEAITKMCTLWAIVEYTSGYLKKQVSLDKTVMRLIRMQLKKAGQFGKRLSVQPEYRCSLLETWDYDHNKKVDTKRLAYEAVEMMTRIQGNFRVPEQGLHDFVVMVEQCHASAEGVCFRSSVLIAHSLYALLSSSGAVTNGEAAFTMMVAALCSNIVIDDSPTVKSTIFGRYNNFPFELIRFKIIQMLIEECQLFRYYDEEKRSQLFESIKVSLINMNLHKFKENMQKLGAKLPGEELDLELVERDQVMRPLLQRILPGLAYLMTHFRLPEFREFFPNFFDEIIDSNKSCIEIILALKWT